MTEITEHLFEDTRFGGKRQLWWPLYDNAPQRTFTHLMARVTDVDITAKLCKQRRTVIQAGGHCGLYPLRLAGMFKQVITFEPDPACFAALDRNCRNATNIMRMTFALGETSRSARLAIKSRPGSASLVAAEDAAKTVDVRVVAIDSMHIHDCDALIIDVEHGECEVLKGARETIRRCSPVIQVEELPRRRDELQALIKGFGYTERRRVHGDAIYTRDKR